MAGILRDNSAPLRRFSDMKFRRCLAFFSLVPFALPLAVAAPPIIDDLAIRASLETGLGGLADAGNPVGAEFLKKANAEAPNHTEVQIDGPAVEASGIKEELYNTVAASTYVVGSVFKCDKCDLWHTGAMATAFCIGSDGLMVTNYHVFENPKGESWGVVGLDGKTHKVIGVVASDAAADLTVFRVEAEGLAALPLGEDAEIGDAVMVVGHPDGRYFFSSSGNVARYWRAPGKDSATGPAWMSITADYAQGSSGGPVVNERGEVVGIVSNTQTLSAAREARTGRSQPGPVQMVIKNTVPVMSLRAMLTAPAAGPAMPAATNETSEADPAMPAGEESGTPQIPEEEIISHAPATDGGPSAQP